MKAKARNAGTLILWIALILMTAAAANEQAVMSLLGW